MDLDACLALVDEVGRAAGARTVERPSSEETVVVLDLARAVAHGVERKAAPLVAFATGRALAELGAMDRIALMRQITARLDAAEATTTE